MPTYGKIASLPSAMRNAVNQMLDENVPESEIAEKLTAIVTKWGNPAYAEGGISRQNVEAWRNNGYQKWLAQSRARELAEKIPVARADGKSVTESSVADNIADCILGELAIEATSLIETKLSPLERQRKIDWLIPHVAALRRGTHVRSWIRLEALKLELAINRAAIAANEEEINDALPKRTTAKGLSDEVMTEIEMAAGFDDDANYEYKYLTQEQIEEIRNEARKL